MSASEGTGERVVMIAPKYGGGVMTLMESGAAGADRLRVVVSVYPYIQRRALAIVRRHYPAYRAGGAELHLFGKRKAGAK